MTATLTLSARQVAAGAPIDLVLAARALNPTDDAVVAAFQGIGVTTTTTPPATFAAFAHWDGSDANFAASTLWDKATETFRNGTEGGVSTVYDDSVITEKRQRVDANYVAGRYLWGWIVAAIAGTPSATVPAVLAGPYHIQ
jgi:hypothetical protein